ncbi:hypothetical protein BJQ89_03528 [Arthrobacter sp. ES1]|nr:hypothetical protein [Arthrobacter sp. ES1]
MAGLRTDVDGFALHRRAAAVDAGHHVVALTVELCVAVDVGVGSELFDDVDLNLQALAGGDGFEVFRTAAEGHGLAVGSFEDVARYRVHGAAELHAAVDHGKLEQVHCGRADKAGHKNVLRLVVEVARGVDLHQQAVLQDGNAVAHGHGLDLVVGHIDRGDTQPAGQGRDLRAGLDPELGVKVGQRLVHKEHLRVADDGTTHGNTLALATGECLRLAVQVRLEIQQLGSFTDAFGTLFLADAGDLQREAHVVRDRHVRVQGVVLEDHGDVAVLRGNVGDIAVTNQDPAGVDVLETCEHPQGGRLATAGGSNEDQEFAIGDFNVELVNCGLVRARVHTCCVVKSNCSHSYQSLHRQVRAGRSVVNGLIFQLCIQLLAPDRAHTPRPKPRSIQ